LNDSAFCCIAEAVALPCASIMAASARPRALFASASAMPVALATSALAKPVALEADAAPAASVSSWNFFALASVSTLYRSSAVGFGLRDLGIALDLGNARLAQRVEVALCIPDVADGEAHDAQAHVGHVARGHFLHFGGKGVAVLVNLLHSHRAEDGAQMALER